MLYEQIEQITTDRASISSHYITLEINKGRCERRHVLVSDCVEGISKEWIGLNQIIKIERITKIKDKQQKETAYYISSKKLNALFYCDSIRSHWGIENSLHWVKDVTFEEDCSKIRTMNAPQNISTIKNIAINIFRKNKYRNMAQAQRLVANNIPLIKSLIT
jgi:predicted transposase YbfD/YdcC